MVGESTPTDGRFRRGVYVMLVVLGLLAAGGLIYAKRAAHEVVDAKRAVARAEQSSLASTRQVDGLIAGQREAARRDRIAEQERAQLLARSQTLEGLLGRLLAESSDPQVRAAFRAYQHAVIPQPTPQPQPARPGPTPRASSSPSPSPSPRSSDTPSPSPVVRICVPSGPCLPRTIPRDEGETPMATALDLVTLANRQRGDRYVYGVEDDGVANPTAFDCSELVQWLCQRLGVKPAMVDGAANQLAFCRKRGTLISIGQAAKTPGALLFRIGVPPGDHVVISLGDGARTIEARGKAYGVNNFPIGGRTWTHAALVPGLVYGRTPVPAAPGAQTHPSVRPPSGGGVAVPAFPGRLITPGMVGADVGKFFGQLAHRGWHVSTDARYDPADRPIVLAFQREKGLVVDGFVGVDTWTAAWRAPVTK